MIWLALVAAAAAAGADAETPDAGAPYVPSPHEIVERMLELGDVGPGDYLIDLGSGDGRIVLAAARTRGARGLGIEIRGDLVEQARKSARKQDVADRVSFVEQDLFEADLSRATVVTVYLLPETVGRLRSKLLRELAPGTRVVSHDYPIEGWNAERFEQLEHPAKVQVTGVARTNLYLYRVPGE